MAKILTFNKERAELLIERNSNVTWELLRSHWFSSWVLSLCWVIGHTHFASSPICPDTICPRCFASWHKKWPPNQVAGSNDGTGKGFEGVVIGDRLWEWEQDLQVEGSRERSKWEAPGHCCLPIARGSSPFSLSPPPLSPHLDSGLTPKGQFSCCPPLHATTVRPPCMASSSIIYCKCQ